MVYFFLATFKDITLVDGLVEKESQKCQKLIETLGESFKEQKSLFDILIKKDSIPFKLDAQKDPSIPMLLMHIFILLNSQQKLPLLKIFKRLLNEPAKFENSYLPSIPHDDDFEAFENFKKNNQEPLKFYQCKNGHLYSIGDCTKPAMVSTCPTCKEKIGGAGYVLEEGNTEADTLTEKTQHGYFINESDLNNPKLESIRNMGIFNTTLLRLILDCVLLLASEKNSQEAFKVLNPSIQVNQEDLVEFFNSRIKLDLKHLSECLQHSPEESLLLVHFILNNLNKDESSGNALKSYLSKKEERNKFENLWCEFVNQKVIKNDSTDKIITQMTNILMEDHKNSGSDRLFRIAYDLIEPNESDSEFYNEKSFWMFRKQITFDTMINSYKSMLNNENKVKFKLLDEFILRLNELKAIKYLPSIYKMLSLLYTAFNKQIDKQNSVSLTLGDFMQEGASLGQNLNSRETVETGTRDF